MHSVQKVPLNNIRQQHRYSLVRYEGLGPEFDQRLPETRLMTIAPTVLHNWLQKTLSYWARYKDSAGFWIHPSRPSALIDEGVESCNSLLRYFHCMLGRQPLWQNWGEERSQNLVGNDARLVASIKALQSCVSMMRPDGWIGRNASQLYEDGNLDSVGLTISSLIFTEMADAQVKDFH
ncbi:hypothetical protein VTI74DRAFT_11492 [Chaetomium olivicolor]